MAMKSCVWQDARESARIFFWGHSFCNSGIAATAMLFSRPIAATASHSRCFKKTLLSAVRPFGALSDRPGSITG